MAREKCGNKPTHLGPSGYSDETDEKEIEDREGKPQEIVAAPAHPAVLDGQKDLIENVERNEQQTKSRNRKQIASVRRQQQRNQEIPDEEIQQGGCQSHGNANGDPIAFAFGILCNFPRKNPVAAHQSQVAQNGGP